MCFAYHVINIHEIKEKDKLKLYFLMPDHLINFQILIGILVQRLARLR